jgi:hypothetical protein
VQVEQAKARPVACRCKHRLRTHHRAAGIEFEGDRRHAERIEALSLREIAQALRPTPDRVADDPRQHGVAQAAVGPRPADRRPQGSLLGDMRRVRVGIPCPRCRGWEHAFVKTESGVHAQEMVDGDGPARIALAVPGRDGRRLG